MPLAKAKAKHMGIRCILQQNNKTHNGAPNCNDAVLRHSNSLKTGKYLRETRATK